MPLTENSTPDEVRAEARRCASYSLTQSVEMAQQFIVACRILQMPGMSLKRAVHGGKGADEVENDTAWYAREMDKAERWLALQPGLTNPVIGGGGVVFPDFSVYR